MAISRDSRLFRYANMVVNLSPETGSDIVLGCFLTTLCLTMWALILTPFLHIGSAYFMLWYDVAPQGATIWHEVGYIATLPFQVGVALAFHLTLKVLGLLFTFAARMCNRIIVEAPNSSLFFK